MSRHTIALLAATVSLRLLLFNRFWHLAMSLPTSSDAPKGAPHRTNSDSSPQFAQNPSGLNFRERAGAPSSVRPSLNWAIVAFLRLRRSLAGSAGMVKYGRSSTCASSLARLSQCRQQLLPLPVPPRLPLPLSPSNPKPSSSPPSELGRQVRFCSRCVSISVELRL